MMSAYVITVLAPTLLHISGDEANACETTDNAQRDALVAAEVLDSLGHEVKVIL